MPRVSSGVVDSIGGNLSQTRPEIRPWHRPGRMPQGRPLESPPPRLFGVVVVHHHMQSETLRLLESIHSWPEVPSRVILADTSAPSYDWSDALERFEAVEILLLPHNPGYGASVNECVQTLGRTINFILVMSHEVEIDGQTVSGLLDSFFGDDAIAVVAPRLAFKSQPSLIFSCGGRISDRGVVSHEAHRSPVSTCKDEGENLQDVAWVDGSCFFIALDAFKAVGGFDERYFLYVEEVDLFLRVRLSGRRVVVNHSFLAHQEPGYHSTFLRYRNHILFTVKFSQFFGSWPWVRELVLDAARMLLRGMPFSLPNALSGVIAAKRLTASWMTHS